MITEVIPLVSGYSGTIPDKATQTKTEFANNVQPFLNYINAIFVPDNSAMITSLNIWTSEANNLKDEVNAMKDTAVTAKDTALASSNYKGLWSSLSGALNTPASVSYNGVIWLLNTNLADVTTSIPDKLNSDWTALLVPFNYIYKNTNYTAYANDFIYCDTSTSSFTVTLPATPTANDVVNILDNTTSFKTNPLSVARNGNNIMGLAQDMIIDVDNISVSLIFNGTEWRII